MNLGTYTRIRKFILKIEGLLNLVLALALALALAMALVISLDHGNSQDQGP